MLRNDRRGAAAVEFALTALFLIMVVVGTIEIGWQLETEAALRNGVDEAIRFASTGQSIVPNVKAFQRVVLAYCFSCDATCPDNFKTRKPDNNVGGK